MDAPKTTPDFHIVSDATARAGLRDPEADGTTGVRRRVTVMVLDDQALFRSGLMRLLEDDERLDVKAASPEADNVPDACRRASVDVLVTDLQLEAGDGIELTRRVRQASPGTKVLILTSIADTRVVSALAAGAAGFLLKDAQPESIRSAVHSVYLGEQVLSPQAAQWLVGVAGANGGPMGGRHLTRREVDVLRLVALGTSYRDTAQILDISEKSVRNYVSGLYRKLALHNRAQIAVYARETGLT